MIGRVAAWYRENVSESADCMACRLISGFGMMGIGAFVLAQAKRRNSPLEKYTMQSIAAGGHIQIYNIQLFIQHSVTDYSCRFPGRCTHGRRELLKGKDRTCQEGNQTHKRSCIL